MSKRFLVGRLLMVLPLVGLAGCPNPGPTGTDTADTGEGGDTGDTADTGTKCPDGSDPRTWYGDDDRDTYGDVGNVQVGCDKPMGFVEDATDCDDDNGDVHPGATEFCNGADDDCDGATDEEAVDTLTGYPDIDEDGYGDAASPVTGCDLPDIYVADATDCDDGDASVHPGATDLCSGVDEDCDGVTDAAGTAMYENGSGVRFDVSAALAAGTAASPTFIGDQAGYAVEAVDGTVSLCEGTWYTKIVVAESRTNLTVVGRAGAASTTITTGGTTGGAGGSVIAVTGATLTVRGLTITGGIGSEGNTKGGGVAVTQPGAVASVPNVSFYDSVITGNVTDYGGGIALFDYASVSLHDSWLEGNSANQVGGGVWVQEGGVFSCEASDVGLGGVVENLAPIAGGFYFSSKTAGIVDSVGCSWGDTGLDDNFAYDVQRQPYYANAWCFGNATATTDLVYCDSSGCTGTQVQECVL